MDKLKMESKNNVQGNIEKIRELFPNAVTEVLRDGKPTLAVDFDVLKQEMSDTLIDDKEERYQFTWPDKKKSILLANTPINATLRPCKEESVNFDTTENLYIEGDNLDVLKLLQETYLGKIKMIYIDPPYNTGNDFVYNDDFAESSEEYLESSGQYDEQGNRLVQNTESNGRFHTDWLNMIYPRLKVAKDLLTDDGIIFISVDDHEQSNMKKVCEEIFGESNFITKFVWEKTQHFGRQKLNSYSNCDYIFCYAKNLISDKLKELLVEKTCTDLGDAPLFNASNNINDLTFPAGVVKFNMRDGEYAATNSDDYKLLNSVIVKNGKNENDFTLRFRSRWSNTTVQEEIKKGTTFWVKTESFAIRAIYGEGKTSNVAPKQLIFTNSNNPMCAYSRFGDRVDTSENASAEVADIVGDNMFSYPKPKSLIAYLISLLYDEGHKKYDNDFIVLDFFSGSATTAHAVMQLNAEDGGNRKFIMVQLPEKCDENSEAFKAGYKNICEIGKERIRRAGKKIVEPASLLEDPKNVDIGFRVLKLDSSNMKDVYYKPQDYTQNLLDSLESNIKEDRTPLDLLFQVMLDLGKPLSAKIEEKTIRVHMPIAPGSKYYNAELRTNDRFYKVYYVDGNDLIACFDEGITESVIKEIAQQKPLYAVFRDSGLSSDSTSANFDQIFATYSPNTTRKVL